MPHPPSAASKHATARWHSGRFPDGPVGRSAGSSPLVWIVTIHNGQEDVFPAVAPAHHMADGTGMLDSRFSWLKVISAPLADGCKYENAPQWGMGCPLTRRRQNNGWQNDGEAWQAKPLPSPTAIGLTETRFSVRPRCRQTPNRSVLPPLAAVLRPRLNSKLSTQNSELE